ncbi:MAG: hypothetical protein CMF48_04620 [Legionellales bacterium]|nr:hypothetical protein [Legionellales bacterium]|tara:strand:+ start:121 stop:321 length:201 start_codon:yes stop_codon:yes gene_type:complete
MLSPEKKERGYTPGYQGTKPVLPNDVDRENQQAAIMVGVGVTVAAAATIAGILAGTLGNRRKKRKK